VKQADKTLTHLELGGGALDLGKLPTQTAFMSDHEHRFRAYGGGYANGKTTAGCVLAVLLSHFIPDNRGFIGRWDGKELRQSTMAEFFKVCPPQMIDKRNDQQGLLRFKPQYGGSEILYGDLKEDVVGPNLGWFWIDQAEEVEEARWNTLVGRLRKQTPMPQTGGEPFRDAQGNILYAPTYGLATFNPEGRSHWLWRFFHPDSPEVKPGYRLYEAQTYDGLAAGFVSKDYVDGMLAVFPPEAVKRYLEGSWDVFEGRIYPQFAVDTHVLEHIPIKPHWKIYESIDHGIQNPTAVGWYVVDESSNVYLIDEHYEGNGKPVVYHAQIIKAKRAALEIPIAVTYLDAHCWAKDQVNGPHVYSIADEYQEHGIYPVPGQKDKKAGINRVTEHLAIDPNRRHPITGELGSPRLFAAAHCRHFINEMLGYRWKKARGLVQRNEPDVPQDYNDHHMDALSYFLLTRPQQPVITIEPKLNALEKWAKQRKAYNPLTDEPKTAGTWMSV
jgi:hypothetical protein